MPRTIDATLPPPPYPPSKDKSTGLCECECDLTDVSKHSILPKPLQIISSSKCHDVPQTVLHQIQSLIDKQNDGVPISTSEEDALDDGFLLCDLRTIQRKLTSWRIMFPRIKPFFALKCNPDCMVAHTLGLENDTCGFDCASIAEIELALAASNNNNQRIVYANPQRAKRDLEQALQLNVGALTFDGIEELHKVKEAYLKRVELCGEHSHTHPPPLPPQMILRLLVPDGHSSVPLGEKFGAPPDRVPELTTEALNLGFDVIGVSFHCGSGCHDADAYGEAIQIAANAMKDINLVIQQWNDEHGNEHESASRVVPKCTLLDIGGGYPGLCGIGSDVQRFSSQPSDFDSFAKTMSSRTATGTSTNIPSIPTTLTNAYDDADETTYKIAKVVTPLINELFPPPATSTTTSGSETSSIEIISEPGRYFVEGAFIYCARIYSAKVDGVDGCGDPNMRMDGSTSSTVSPRTCSRRHYYIAQGVQGLFKDVLLCDETFTPTPLKVVMTTHTNHPHDDEDFKSDSKSDDRPPLLIPSTIHGPSGEEFDIVSKDCMLPELNVGDWLIFDRMGAYTLSIAARNSSLPVRYVLGGAGGGGC